MKEERDACIENCKDEFPLSTAEKKKRKSDKFYAMEVREKQQRLMETVARAVDIDIKEVGEDKPEKLQKLINRVKRDGIGDGDNVQDGDDCEEYKEEIKRLNAEIRRLKALSRGETIDFEPDDSDDFMPPPGPAGGKRRPLMGEEGAEITPAPVLNYSSNQSWNGDLVSPASRTIFQTGGARRGRDSTIVQVQPRTVQRETGRLPRRGPASAPVSLSASAQVPIASEEDRDVLTVPRRRGDWDYVRLNTALTRMIQRTGIPRPNVSFANTNLRIIVLMLAGATRPTDREGNNVNQVDAVETWYNENKTTIDAYLGI